MALFDRQETQCGLLTDTKAVQMTYDRLVPDARDYEELYNLGYLNGEANATYMARQSLLGMLTTAAISRHDHV